MMAQTAAKSRDQIARFSGNLSAGLCKSARRIERDTLLVLDLSDIVKPYAEKMEHLATVRDGRTGEFANGYWTVHVIGVENESHDITPLYGELYSQEADDFVSENQEILQAVSKISAACEKRGVWVIDCGELYQELVPRANGHGFIIRQKGDRHLLYKGRKVPTLEVVCSCPMLYATTIVKEDKHGEKEYRLECGYRPVRLPEHPEVELYLVVVKGFGEEAMLLPDRPLRKNREVIWWVVSAYLTRWRIEETTRYVKQCYEVEDVRVLRDERLRTLLVLVRCVMFFACVELGLKSKLEILA